MIEDKASGTQLIQEMVNEGMHAIKKYEPTMDKTMRMHSVTSTIENGFAHIPDRAAWLGEYMHELTSFPKGKYDDQADSTSQALDWFQINCVDRRSCIRRTWISRACRREFPENSLFYPTTPVG